MTIVQPALGSPTRNRVWSAASSRATGESQLLVRHRIPLDVKLFLVAVFVVPVQLDAGSGGVLQSRISPSDMLLAVLLLVTPGVVRLRGKAVDLLPLGLVATLSFGTLLAIFHAGEVTNHTIRVKLAGGIVLALFAVVTAKYTRDGWGEQILKIFLAGLAFWGLIAYVDWKLFDVLPLVDPKISTRFGGMQYDPNNAGASYAVALLMTLVIGRRVFNRQVWIVATIISAVALGLTLSRGGYISCATAAAVVLIVDRPSMQRSLRIVAGGVVVLAGAVATGIVGTAVNDFSRRPDNVAGRSNFAKSGIVEFVDSGGVGIGLGTFRLRYGDIIHNTAVWLVVEMSAVGLAFLLAMAVIPAVAAIRLRAIDRPLGNALLGGHVVMLVASLGIEALYQRSWWLIVGLIAGFSSFGLPSRTSITGRGRV
jgi:putative inorganic carbon (hco3(-)) transporter